MSESWFDVSETAEKTNIPSDTVRRYVREHGVHLRIKKSGKYYYIHEDSLETLKQIRKHYSDGKKKIEIEELLSVSGIPMTITVDSDNERMKINVAEELLAMKKEILQQREQNEKQQEILLQLVQETMRSREIMGSLQNRVEAPVDKQITETIKHTFSEMAAAHEAQRRDERFLDTSIRMKVENELMREALREWNKKPLHKRMTNDGGMVKRALIDMGFFRKEDMNKRDLFIREYIHERIDERLEKAFNLD